MPQGEVVVAEFSGVGFSDFTSGIEWVELASVRLDDAVLVLERWAIVVPEDTELDPVETCRKLGDEERGVLGCGEDDRATLGDCGEVGVPGVKSSMESLEGKFLILPLLSLPSERVSTLMPSPLSLIDGMKSVVAPFFSFIWSLWG